ncbi:hypothetical protein BSKO_00809 [Bryopsis sp. KO-2023]|nr:hypothetical protein BSKO_00809 [Bryopsis sp. KO-2023]
MDADIELAKVLQEQEEALYRHSCQSGRSFGAAASSPSAGPSTNLSDEELARRLQREDDTEHWRSLTGSGSSGLDDYLSDDPVDVDAMTYEELQALGEVVGSVNKGLPEAAIEAIPVQMYKPTTKESQMEEQCAICQCEFDTGEMLKSLPCKHMYHPPCISQWLSISKTCPVCNTEVQDNRRSSDSSSLG